VQCPVKERQTDTPLSGAKASERVGNQAWRDSVGRHALVSPGQDVASAMPGGNGRHTTTPIAV
jgi:hypothetical protein